MGPTATSRAFPASASSRPGRGRSSTSTAGGGSGRRFASALGVLRHLLGQGSRYDVVHSGSTPFFPLLAAGLARRRGRYRLLVDWIEVWTLAYWRSYLGRLKGTIAWTIQRLATRVGERAFCFSRLHERRLRDEGFRGPVDVIGVYTGPLDRPEPEPAEPAGRVRRAAHSREGRARPPGGARPGAGDGAGAARGDPRRRAAEGRGRAAGGGGRAGRRRRGAGLRPGGAGSRLDPPQPLPRASVDAGGLRPRRGRGGSRGSPERRRGEPRQRRAGARRGRRQRRRRPLDRAGRACRRRSSACTRPGLPCAPRPPTGSRGTRGRSRWRARSRR